MEEKYTCPYGNDGTEEPHTCPYEVAINDNDEPFCSCCETCKNDCIKEAWY